jgi:hypothetical protein
MRPGATHHRDDQWRTRKPVALEIDLVGGRIRTVGTKYGRDRFAGGGPSIAFEQDESPRRELAMVRHA